MTSTQYTYHSQACLVLRHLTLILLLLSLSIFLPLSLSPYLSLTHAHTPQVLVSFKDRVRLYNILMGSLKPFKEAIIKSCREIKYSRGCQYWAGASAINVVVYDSVTCQQLMNFQGHMMPIRCVCVCALVCVCVVGGGVCYVLFFILFY